MKFRLSLFLFACLLASSNAFAGIPILYWDNQEGFVEAENCDVTGVDEQRFRISRYSGSGDSLTENLRNYDHVKQSHLVNYSLVKLIDGPQRNNYKRIEVVGVNQGIKIERNQWFSERLDQGYLYSQSLLAADGYVIELLESGASHRVGTVFETSRGKYLSLAKEDHYFQLDCPQFHNRDYVVFKMFDENSKQAEALIGIYWDETGLFKSISTMSKQHALESVLTELEEVSIDDLLSQETPEPKNKDKRPGPVDVPEKKEPTPRDNETTNGGVDNVVCTDYSPLNVRDDSLNRVLFTAAFAEKLTIFQSWTAPRKKTKVINGVSYDFIKVRFIEREANDQRVGWVAQDYVKPRNECPYLKDSGNKIPPRPTDIQISGLNDPKCCRFPMVERTTHAYDSGMRRFGAGRFNGTRSHAACDLYRYKNEPVISVAPGTVLRKYLFYQGTYAIEVAHTGGFIGRYSEITGKFPQGTWDGARVKMGQRVGYVGKVNSNCCHPMMHFELYSGSRRGPLTQNGNKYGRRPDLLNPTPYLKKWERMSFDYLDFR